MGIRLGASYYGWRLGGVGPSITMISRCDMLRLLVSFVLLCGLGSSTNVIGSKLVFIGDDGHSVVKEIRGAISENETVVRLSPSLRVRLVSNAGDDIASSEDAVTQPLTLCSVYLHQPNPSVLPFVASYSGDSIQIVVRNQTHVSYNQQPSYKFQITAADCQQHHSVSALIHVHVEPTSLPQFSSESFTIAISSSIQPETVIGHFPVTYQSVPSNNLTASKDAGICEYRLEYGQQEGVPFRVDRHGILVLTQLVEAGETYDMQLRAASCEHVDVNGKTIRRRWSKPVSIRIRIVSRCTPILRDVPHRLIGETGRTVEPFLNSSIVFCDPREPSRCFAEACARNFSLRLRLVRGHPSASESKAKCGAGALSDPGSFPRLAKCASTDDAIEMPLIEDPIDFDGARIVEIEKPEAISTITTQKEPFAITWWMQRLQSVVVSKGQLFCLSAGESSNRHYFSVSVLKCKLSVLMRSEGVAETIEWRFDLGSSCDTDWHHLALLVDAGAVRLVIDGDTVTGNRIVSPHDGSHHADEYKLVLGACYHAAANRYMQFFSGKLASVSIVRGLAASSKFEQTVRCLASCSAVSPWSAGLFSEAASVETTADRITDLVAALRAVRLVPRTRGEHAIELSLAHVRDDFIGECLIEEPAAATRLVIAVEQEHEQPSQSQSVDVDELNNAPQLVYSSDQTTAEAVPVPTSSNSEPEAIVVGLPKATLQHKIDDSLRFRGGKQHTQESAVWLVPIAMVVVGAAVCVALFVSARARQNGDPRIKPPNTTCVDVGSLEMHLDNRLNENGKENGQNADESDEIITMTRVPDRSTLNILGTIGSFAKRVSMRMKPWRSIEVAGEGELEWDSTGSQLHIVDNPFALDGSVEDESDSSLQSRIRLVNENLAFGNALLTSSLLLDREIEAENESQSQSQLDFIMAVSAKHAALSSNLAVSEKHLNIDEAFESIDSTSESEAELLTPAAKKANGAACPVSNNADTNSSSKSIVSESRSCYDRLDKRGTRGPRLTASRSTSSFCAKSTMLLRNVTDSARQSRLKSRDQRFLDTSSSSSDDDVEGDSGSGSAIASNAGSSGYHYSTLDGSFSKMRLGSEPDFFEAK